MAAILEDASDPFFVLDRECRIQHANHAAERLMGSATEEVAGDLVWEICPGSFSQAIQDELQDPVVHDRSVGFKSHFSRTDVWLDMRAAVSPRGILLWGREVSAASAAAAQEPLVAAVGRWDRLATQLHEREEQLRMIVDAVPVLISYVDPDFRYRLVNRTYEHWFGVDPRDVPGKRVDEVVGQEIWERIRPYMERAMKGELVTYEDHRVDIKGAPRTVHTICSPDRDPHTNEVRGIVVLVTDVTERAKAEEALRWSEQLLAQAQRMAHVGSWEFELTNLDDFDSNTLRWSDEAFRIFGYEPGQVPVSNALFFQAVHPDDRATVAAAVQESLSQSRIYEVDHRIVRPDGSIRFVHEWARIVTDPNGRPLRMLGTCQDITERQQVQAEMRRAKEAAESASRAKDQFLATLSHELRTPLAPVTVAVSLLEGNENLPEAVRQDMAMVRRNIALETRIIDDLLDFSRVINGKLLLQIRPVPLRPLLLNVLQILDGSIKSKELKVELDLRAARDQVNVDESRFQQVLWNLIQNAVKFTPHGGWIRIRTWNSGDEDKFLFIEVSDSGVGIDPDRLTSIFDAFEQEDQSVTRKFGGLGLGLAISKAIVGLHGGIIRAFSQGKDRGAQIRIELPTVAGVEVTEFNQNPLPQGPGTAASGLRILLVEDHADTLRVLRKVLTNGGHTVSTATTVAEAHELAASGIFDIFLCDIGLPDGSGLDLMKQITQAGLKLPGIAITGYGTEQDIVASQEAGFAAHLTKPVDLSTLTRTLDQVAGRSVG